MAGMKGFFVAFSVLTLINHAAAARADGPDLLEDEEKADNANTPTQGEGAHKDRNVVQPHSSLVDISPEHHSVSEGASMKKKTQHVDKEAGNGGPPIRGEVGHDNRNVVQPHNSLADMGARLRVNKSASMKKKRRRVESTHEGCDYLDPFDFAEEAYIGGFDGMWQLMDPTWQAMDPRWQAVDVNPDNDAYDESWGEADGRTTLTYLYGPFLEEGWEYWLDMNEQNSIMAWKFEPSRYSLDSHAGEVLLWFPRPHELGRAEDNLPASQSCSECPSCEMVAKSCVNPRTKHFRVGEALALGSWGSYKLVALELPPSLNTKTGPSGPLYRLEKLDEPGCFLEHIYACSFTDWIPHFRRQDMSVC